MSIQDSPVSPVRSKLNSLEAATGLLNESLDHLQKKIAPVTNYDRAVAAAGGNSSVVPAQPTCELAAELECLLDRVRMMVERVDAMTDQVEL